MLYEVITLTMNKVLLQNRQQVVHQPVNNQTGREIQEQDRITSYNVCYTKLLRLT